MLENCTLRSYSARVEQINLIFEQGNKFGDLHYASTDSMKIDDKDVFKYVIDDFVHLPDLQKYELADSLHKFADILFCTILRPAKVNTESVNLHQILFQYK